MGDTRPDTEWAPAGFGHWRRHRGITLRVLFHRDPGQSLPRGAEVDARAQGGPIFVTNLDRDLVDLATAQRWCERWAALADEEGQQTVTAQTRRSIAQALTLLESPAPGLPLREQDCSVYTWPQRWGDASCGAGGMACQVLTRAQCVVVGGPCGDAVVCHGGRVARHLLRPSQVFQQALVDRQLPGQAADWRAFERSE